MFLADIATYLQTGGVGTLASTLFYGSMPDTPDELVCVYEYAGSPPEFNLDGLTWVNPGLQVVARSKSYTTARNKIETVFGILASVHNLSYNGNQYLRIEANQSPFSIGPDPVGRHRLAINFSVSIGG